jgi:hypothetical protein
LYKNNLCFLSWASKASFRREPFRIHNRANFTDEETQVQRGCELTPYFARDRNSHHTGFSKKNKCLAGVGEFSFSISDMAVFRQALSVLS